MFGMFNLLVILGEVFSINFDGVENYIYIGPECKPKGVGPNLRFIKRVRGLLNKEARPTMRPYLCHNIWAKAQS